MTVRELITVLAACDPNMQVILQKDDEGNGYRPMNDIDDKAHYISEEPWFGDVVGEEEFQEIAREEGEEYVRELKLDHPRVVIIY